MKRMVSGFSIVAFLVLAFTAGCSTSSSDSPSEAAEIIPGRTHPTPGNIPSDEEVADVLQLPGEAGAGTGVGSLQKARELFAIGVMEGAEHQMFGRIRDIAMDEQHNIYVLDREYQNARIYDADGNYAGSFSGGGEGPGEIMYPQALSYGPEGTITIADRNRHIKRFERQDTSFVFRNQFALEYTPEDLCVMEDRVFVHGYRAETEGIIHVYTPDGEHLRSFGAPYKAGHPFVRESLSRGSMGCSVTDGQIVFMFDPVPVLFGYGVDGTLQWKSKVSGFQSSRITEGTTDDGRPKMSYSNRTNPAHFMTTLLPRAGGGTFLQVAERISQEGSRAFDVTFHNYQLSSSGEGMYLGTRPPVQLTASAGDRWVGHHVQPFPQVKVYQLGSITDRE